MTFVEVVDRDLISATQVSVCGGSDANYLYHLMSCVPMNAKSSKAQKYSQPKAQHNTTMHRGEPSTSSNTSDAPFISASTHHHMMTLLQLLDSVEFAATAIASYLTLADLGFLSATTRVLRYQHAAIGDAFYATSIVRVPEAHADGDSGGATFIERMPDHAARLVTRVRIEDASYLDQARRFVHAKEIDLLSNHERCQEAAAVSAKTRALRHFARLETLTIRDQGVLDHSFLAHLPRLRKLQLHNSTGGIAILDASAVAIAALEHLEHLDINVGHATSLKFLAG